MLGGKEVIFLYIGVGIMDSLFNYAATKVLEERAGDNLIISVVLYKRKGFQWTDINV